MTYIYRQSSTPLARWWHRISRLTTREGEQYASIGDIIASICEDVDPVSLHCIMLISNQSNGKVSPIRLSNISRVHHWQPKQRSPSMIIHLSAISSSAWAFPCRRKGMADNMSCNSNSGHRCSSNFYQVDRYWRARRRIGCFTVAIRTLKDCGINFIPFDLVSCVKYDPDAKLILV